MANLIFSAACRKDTLHAPFHVVLQSLKRRRQAADHNRLAACAPQNVQFALVNALPFGRELGGGHHACRNQAQRAAICLPGRRGTLFVVFGIAVDLPEIVELGVC